MAGKEKRLNKKEEESMRLKSLLIVSVLMMYVSGVLNAQQPEKVQKTFDGIQSIRIKTVSGDCFVKKGESSNVKVEVVWSVEPEGSFEPEFRKSGDELRLEENRYGRSIRGHVTWTLTVPPETEIDFSTASGELSVDGLTKSVEASTASGDVSIENAKGEFDISTASGEINLEYTEGEFDISTASGEINARKIEGLLEFSTASGEIDVNDVRGTFEFSTASGEIEASHLHFEDDAEFSTASGKIEVSLAESPKFDIELSCASGTVTLDYQGNVIKGFFEFTARKDRGRIVSPVSFDQESEYERYNHIYIRKSFTKGSESPKIILGTATGTVRLKK
jgi:DUF4097 and DUF4098 domain-containing protein YvlB